MTVLLYIHDWRDDEGALASTLTGQVAGVSWETCRHPDQLARLTAQPGRQWAALVAAVGSPAALTALAPLGERLARLGLYLILPDHDQAMVALGHRLAPRLLAGGADAPGLIAQVLGQRIKKRETRGLALTQVGG